MEDLLPILIVIAISLIGAAGKKKRKRKPFENLNQEDRGSNENKSPIFDWLEKLNVEEEDPYCNFEEEPEESPEFVEPVVEITPTVEEPKVQEKYKSKYEHYTGFVSQSEKEKLVEKERDFKFHNKSSSIEDDSANGKGARVRKKKKFDLRQAVIYSVVLNRKY